MNEDGDDSGLDEESRSESTESTLALAPTVGLLRQWCVWGMQNIYKEDILQDDRGQQAHTISEEPRIIASEFYSAPMLLDTMTWYHLYWLIDLSGKYSLALVQEFYVSYTTTIIEAIPKKEKPFL